LATERDDIGTAAARVEHQGHGQPRLGADGMARLESGNLFFRPGPVPVAHLTFLVTEFGKPFLGGWLWQLDARALR
jgi:hypothetical protein